jgi:hypothetical protein
LELKELIELADSIAFDNKKYDAAITGSLALYLWGETTRREPGDIDIIVSKKITDKMLKEIKLPKGAVQKSPIYPDSVVFKYKGIFIDILYSEEERHIYDGYILASIKNIIEAKISFACQANDASLKHREDLGFLGVTIVCPEDDISVIF